MKQALFLMILLCAAIAQAATYSTQSDGECAQVVTYEQPTGVAYEPGVDSAGWAVAPADLTPPPLTAKDFSNVTIGLDIPVGNYLADDTYNYDDSRSDIALGSITVRQDGETILNGARLNRNHLPVRPECR